MAIRLWQEIYPPGAGPASLESDHMPALFHYDMNTPHLPRPGDEIYLGRPGDEDTANSTAQRIYWHLDGIVHVELTPYHVDPGPDMKHHITSGLRKHWNSADGDLAALLEQAGWVRGYR